MFCYEWKFLAMVNLNLMDFLTVYSHLACPDKEFSVVFVV